MTNNLKISVQLVTVLFALVLLVSCEKAHASDEETSLTRALNAATCFIYGKALKLPMEELKVYIKRVGKYNEHPSVVYTMGYHSAVVDVFASANAQKIGSYALARIDAAKYHYKVYGCTTA